MAEKLAKKHQARARRRKHIAKKIRGTAEKPRLVVFRSARHIYVQIVDDANHRTITSVSTLSQAILADVSKAKSKVEKAKLVGKQIAKLLREKKISKVVFDRAGYLYHGRVKALADGAREEGLKF